MKKEARNRRMNDPAYPKKVRYWEMRLWKKKHIGKYISPLPGAIAVMGKDYNNRSIILPADYYETTRIKIKDTRIAASLTNDYMEVVNERLAPYTIRKKNASRDNSKTTMNLK